ncbi:autotransporter outer membrane beta-barrel domain-containing protein [Phascolarctobacterium faecium]|uniref:autotransporter outer membrane beta-barrel domain-containing protein n=1 Tax=Phascolarctobacterium faecium TaxID=33025 RepID=UPI003FD7BBE6
MGYIRKADYFKVKPMEEGAALESGLLNMIGEEVDEAYYTDTMSLCLNPELTERNGADTRIVYTPLHGSGNVPVREILRRIGIKNISVVKEQEEPDGSFPTVKAPNPEDPNAFTLAYDYKQPDGTAAVAAGKYLYHLQYNQEDGDWYLKTLLNKDDTPVVNPSVPLYEAYPEIMLGYMKVNTLEERVGNRKWHIIEDGEPQQHLQYQEGTWFKTEGLSGKYKADRSTAAPDSSYDVDSWKMQMGYDKIISRQDAATTVVGGLNLQMGQARARIKSAVGNGKIKSDGKGLGGTMTWYKDNGVYVDTQAQAVWFDSDISSSSSAAAQQIEGNKGFGYGLSVETGKRIALKRPHWSWTTQMQLAYSNVDFDSFSDVNGLAVKRGSADSLQGRLGAALNYEKSYKNENDENYRSVKAYGLLNVYHEFHDGTNVLIAGDNFASKNDPTWLGLAVGGTYNYGRNSQYSLYGELGISTSAKNFGDSHVLRGEVGFRYRF